MIINQEIVQPMLDFCKEKYDAETFEHVKRVAEYTIQSPLTIYAAEHVYNDIDLLYCIALAHDLLEDTDATVDDIISHMPCPVRSMDIKSAHEAREIIKNVLFLLTRQIKHTSYNMYCERIKADIFLKGNWTSYCIKLADIKDHFAQKDTLTDSLKERYVTALTVLL